MTRAAEAVNSAERAVELIPIERDGSRGPDWEVNLAEVMVRLGDLDRAVQSWIASSSGPRPSPSGCSRWTPSGHLTGSRWLPATSGATSPVRLSLPILCFLLYSVHENYTPYSRTETAILPGDRAPAHSQPVRSNRDARVPRYVHVRGGGLLTRRNPRSRRDRTFDRGTDGYDEAATVRRAAAGMARSSGARVGGRTRHGHRPYGILARIDRKSVV